jgi:hypothetical protein
MTKRYLQIKWIHSNPHEPVEFFYELENGQWASRSIQLFADGSSSSATYGMKEAQIPALEEINLDPQLRGSEITEEEFDAVWSELISC